MAAIEKVAIYDARLVQTPPVYGVQKGALSVSTSKFAALAASTGQHTYQILVPSLNVFVDRKIVWDAGVYVTSQVWPTLPCDPIDSAYLTTKPNGTGTNTAGWGGSAAPSYLAQADQSHLGATAPLIVLGVAILRLAPQVLLPVVNIMRSLSPVSILICARFRCSLSAPT